MNIFFKRLHVFRLALPWYYCGEFIRWRQGHAIFSVIIFGHKIVLYNK